MDKPLVSVIIPTYNREATLAASIKSALAQSYRQFEVIVVDDGSVDGTEAIVKSFGDQVRFVRQPNSGPAGARNRGVECTKGELVAFLDSDDTWAPEKLERQVRLLEKAGRHVPCCLCNIRFTVPQWDCPTSFELARLRPALPEGVWHNPSEVLATRFVLFNQALMVRRDALLRAGLFRPQFRVLEDWDFAVRLSFLEPWTYAADSLVTYGRPQANSVTRWGKSDPTFLPGLARDILSEQSTNPAANPFVRKTLRREARQYALLYKAASWQKSGSAVGKRAGAAVAFAIRMRNGVHRRLVWRPMRVQSVDEYAAGGQR